MKKINFAKLDKSLWSFIVIVAFLLIGSATNDNKDTAPDDTETTTTETSKAPSDNSITAEPDWNENSTEDETVEVDDDEVIFSNSPDDDEIIDSIAE